MDYLHRTLVTYLILVGPQGVHQPRTTLVFFLGGCTYTEVAALRFLGQQEEGMYCIGL